MDCDSGCILTILFSAERITHLVNGLDLQAFEGDLARQDIVLRRFAMIRDAACRMSADFRARHADLPWERWEHLGILAYGGTTRRQIEALWHAIEHDLPGVIGAITPLVEPDPFAPDSAA
jgi:uncharacterized protein with HEPN domain